MVSCGGGSDEDHSEEIEKNALLMQDFVIDISDYAKNKKSGFIIIPQNGAELAFNYADPDEGIMMSYVNAIDGIGIEELFYDGSLSVDKYRLEMLRELKSSYPQLTIMVSDYVSKDADVEAAIKRSTEEGFISFPRRSNNYDYMFIPTVPPSGVNTDDIDKLSKAENYLYLISTDNFPNKEAMIAAIAATNYDVVLIDLFFDKDPLTPVEVQSLKTKANGKKRLVIAYISIGSAENYRYYWQTGWKKGNPSWLKKKYEGYSDEFWVEFWHPDWQDIIFGNDDSYIKKIIDAGFDGAYLDNVEAYYFLVED